MIFREVRYKGERMTNEDAVALVQCAMRFDSEVTLESGARKMNGKSLMGVISLALQAGDGVTVIAHGDDETAAVDAVAQQLGK